MSFIAYRMLHSGRWGPTPPTSGGGGRGAYFRVFYGRKSEASLLA